MDHLGVSAETIDIAPLALQTFQELGHAPFGIDCRGLDVEALQGGAGAASRASARHDLIFENVQARLRTFLLMSRGFVVGTGDLSELALGWSTYNGDHMSMYNPNCSIPKTLVKFLVRYVAHERVRRGAGARDPALDRRRRRSRPSCCRPPPAGEIEQSTEDDARPLRAARLHPVQRGPVRLLAREDPLPEPSTPRSPSPTRET